MSPSMAAFCQAPSAQYSTPWMPLGRCEIASAGQYGWALCRKPIRMSPV